MAVPKVKNLDPLYEIFEAYLAQRSYDDSAVFTKEVAQVYLGYLDASNIYIPAETRKYITEELEAEVREMLVKKMYGCADPTQYKNRGRVKMLGTKEFLELQMPTIQPSAENKED